MYGRNGLGSFEDFSLSRSFFFFSKHTRIVFYDSRDSFFFFLLLKDWIYNIIGASILNASLVTWSANRRPLSTDNGVALIILSTTVFPRVSDVLSNTVILEFRAGDGLHGTRVTDSLHRFVRRVSSTNYNTRTCGQGERLYDSDVEAMSTEARS